jgi:hypothetical protein
MPTTKSKNTKNIKNIKNTEDIKKKQIPYKKPYKRGSPCHGSISNSTFQAWEKATLKIYHG